jgi:hypothetical protein
MNATSLTISKEEPSETKKELWFWGRERVFIRDRYKQISVN